jgi:glycosyltransferase involved in cell wall biosynthesis
MIPNKDKVSILMPAYNEEKHIVGNILETYKTFKELGYDFEIVVINDGSSDGTLREVESLSVQYPEVKCKSNLKNYGKGRALKKGFRYCKGEYIVFLDSDMDLHPAQIETFFNIMELDKADVVIGSKRHPNSVLHYPLERRIISSAYFFLIKIMFGLPIKDTQTGLKLFKTEVLKKVFHKVLVKKFAFDLELLVNVHHVGYKIAEAPVILDSKRKLGRIGADSIINMFWDTLAVWYRMYILRYYDE